MKSSWFVWISSAYTGNEGKVSKRSWSWSRRWRTRSGGCWMGGERPSRKRGSCWSRRRVPPTYRCTTPKKRGQVSWVDRKRKKGLSSESWWPTSSSFSWALLILSPSVVHRKWRLWPPVCRERWEVERVILYLRWHFFVKEALQC